MASPFPDLPRDDCGFTPTVTAITLPMMPKPIWTGASDYEDPNYPNGGGPNDVPVAQPPFGQALPTAGITPPVQTTLGGGGSGGAAVLGMIQGGCAPGPTTFSLIQVFDDGTWSDEPAPYLTGYILDRY